MKVYIVWEGNRWGDWWRVIDESGKDLDGKGAQHLKTIKREAPVKTFKKLKEEDVMPDIVRFLFKWSKKCSWYYETKN